MHNAAFNRAALGDFQLCSIKQRCAFSFWRVEQDFTAALLGAVCISVAVRAPVSGSYSITTPSRNHQCSALAEADRAGLSSEKCPEVLNRYRVRRPGREQAPAHPLTAHFKNGFYPRGCSASAASWLCFFLYRRGITRRRD